MKNTLYFLLFASIIFTSCKDEKEKLEKERDELKKEITEKKTELSEIEEKLKAFDSTDTSLSKVEIALAKKNVFEHFFEVQGELKAEKNSILTPESGGKIISINVQEGQYVQEGTVIAVFDQSVISSNIKELENNLEMSKYLYEKQKSLFEQGVGSELQLKQAQAQYESLKQTKQTLNTQQSKFVLKAPYAGHIEKVFVVEGEVASPASAIVRIINLSKVSVVADISEVYLKNLTMNTKVDVIFPAIEDTIYSTNITRMGKFINPANRTIEVEINIPSKEKYIPNLMSVIKVRDFIDTVAIVIPTATVLEDNKGSSFVFKVNKNNEAIKTLVEVESSYKGMSAIKHGVSAGDRVVLRGARKLVNEQKVEIENKQ
jgi:membrane fusion protein, multidrug efflux system